MMQSLPQSFSPHPGAMQQHPGMAPGHQMVHNPGQPGPGMPQQLHMGVSGPGPQVQAGAMMAGMPPGAGGPSAHALSHLNPNQQQQQMFSQQQQQAMFASNPQLQAMHQQQQMQIAQQRQQQAQRQAMLAQQYSGMPVGMPNGISQMTQAQFQAMRGGAGPMARPVNLPQHLQQQQQQAEHTLQQQQQAQAHAQQQQIMMAQQMAMQQAAQAQTGGNPQGQPTQMNAQQPQNIQQAQAAMMQQQQAHQQQQAQAAAASQQSQGQPQPQSQPQPAQPNPQSQPQQPQTPQQQPGLNQQQAQATAAMIQQQQRQGEKLKGQCLMKLMLFSDHLSLFSNSKQKDELQYWLNFVERFFSPKGVLRHSVWLVDENSNKQYEITYPALPRYFHTHFESGVKNMQMIMERGMEKELPNNNHYIESPKSSFVYWFDNGSQLIATGTLKAHFDADQKIELLEFITSSHEEYLPRTRIVEAARPLHEWGKEWHKVNLPPDGKPSPEMNKKGKAKPMKSPAQAPPDIDIPASKVKPSMGITPSVFRFLELAEVMVQMNPLFSYSHQNSSLAPYTALENYVTNVAMNGGNQNPSGARTPGMNNFAVGASPAQAHLNLPGGSPLIGGSPAQAPGMQLQQSQHGTSSSGPSANTSPNVNNKRRRPSTVKAEEENQVNGAQSKTSVKPSPRIGGKRQKGNPA